MKAQVDKDLCSGCAVCIDVCPGVFEMGEDNQAIVMIDPIPPDQEQACREAAEGCPSDAISIEE